MKDRVKLKILDWEENWVLIKSTIMWICTIASFFSIAFSNYIKKYFIRFVCVFIIMTIVIIISRMIREFLRKKLVLEIKGKHVKIVVGNILDYSNEYIKVIPSNEYFDIEVNEEIIPETSLNGQFLKKCNNNGEFRYLKKCLQRNLEGASINKFKKRGKQKKYPIGTGVLFKYEYLIMAFSKFDSSNVAGLLACEYIQFLSELWILVNKYGISKKIVIPLIGGGPSNIDGVDLERKQQYLIESILYTFKMSSINTNVSLHIVLRENDLKSIDFIKLKKIFS